jgi:hypothetical protein
MIRGCDVCGRPYEAKRVSSRFCSGTCRKRNLRAPRPRLAERARPPKITRCSPRHAPNSRPPAGSIRCWARWRYFSPSACANSTPVAGQPRCQRNCAPSWPQRSRAHRRQPILLMSCGPGGTGNAAHKAGPRDDYERNDSHVHTSSSNVELDLVVTQLRGTPDIGYHREHGAPVGPSRYTAPGWCEAPGLASNLSAGYPPSVSEPVAQRPLAGPVGPA